MYEHLFYLVKKLLFLQKIFLLLRLKMLMFFFDIGKHVQKKLFSYKNLNLIKIKKFKTILSQRVLYIFSHQSVQKNFFVVSFCSMNF